MQILIAFLMSNSKLLRVKNKQKMPYKNRKTPSSRKSLHLRPNDRFGFNASALRQCVGDTTDIAPCRALR